MSTTPTEVSKVKEFINSIDKNEDVVKNKQLESKTKIEGIEKMSEEEIISEYEKRYDQMEGLLNEYVEGVKRSIDKLNTYRKELKKANKSKERNELKNEIDTTIVTLNNILDMNINNVNTLLNRISEKTQLYNESETNDLKKEETVNRFITLRDIELRYIMLYSKIKYLEEQSGNSFNRILYDSEVDGKDDVTFKQKILN